MISEKAKKLGEALVTAKVLTKAQLENAVAQAEQAGSTSLIIALLESDLLTFTMFEKFLSASLGIKSIILGERVVEQKTLGLISKKTIDSKFIFPIETKNVGAQKYLIVGMVDPLDTDTLALVKSESRHLITPCLISLSDFKNAVRRNFSGSSKEDPGLITLQEDENMVLIRPGGYEEEIAFQNQAHEETRQDKTVKAQKRTTEIELDTEFSSSQREERDRSNPFIGSNQPRYKEEILAKLGLMGSDARRFRHEKYSREALFKELPEISSKPVEKIFETLSLDLKIEGIINALIAKGLLTRREIYNSAAISYIFGDMET